VLEPPASEVQALEQVPELERAQEREPPPSARAHRTPGSRSHSAIRAERARREKMVVAVELPAPDQEHKPDPEVGSGVRWFLPHFPQETLQPPPDSEPGGPDSLGPAEVPLPPPVPGSAPPG